MKVLKEDVSYCINCNETTVRTKIQGFYVCTKCQGVK